MQSNGLQNRQMKVRVLPFLPMKKFGADDFHRLLFLYTIKQILKHLFSKTGVLYLSEKTNNEYVKNETPQNNIKIVYNQQDDILQYYVDGREEMKAPKDFTADSGYVQFSNGLIINWGRRNAYHDEDHLENIPFAKAFPHQCFNVIASTSKHGGGRLTSYVHDVYNNSWNLLPGYSHGEGSGTTYWMAIGY